MAATEGSPAVGHFHEAPKKIACGLYHSASISDLEHDTLLKENVTMLFTWGRNVHSALGHGERGERADVMSPLKTNEPDMPGCYSGCNYYEVACGSSHTIALIRESDAGCVMYGCGLALNGRLGIERDDGHEMEKNFVPIPLQEALVSHLVVRVCCGADHSLCMTNHGVVCAWGCNTEGQCGVNRRGDVLVPEPVADFPKRRTGELAHVKHFAAGGRHSLMVTSDSISPGTLYTWGCNQQARLGLGHTITQLKPVNVKDVGDTQMVEVAGGEAHSAAIDADKKLWTWGVGANGRLGLGDSTNVPTPRRVKLSDEIAVLEVALGMYHSVALCVSMKKRLVYTWGSGDALGLLPPGDNTVVAMPRLVDLNDISDPKFTNAPVMQVAAGAYHTLLLQENGDILSFGQGANGRLGKGGSKNHSRPVRIGPFGFSLRHRDVENDGKVVRRLRHKSETRAGTNEQAAEESRENWEIKQVACGDMHTAALTYGGDLYLWGCSEHGQLGFNSKESGWVPRQLMLYGKKVAEVALGSAHCLALTRNGEVFAWGLGDSGQLGLGRNEDILQPRKINELKDALTISAGEEHSAAICRMSTGSGNVLWTWGSTHSGKLGLADCFSTATHPPTQVEEYRGLDEKPSPLSVVCGQYHTAVVCQDVAASRRILFTCGNGWFGRLGHANVKKENEYLLKAVEGLSDSVILVAVGADHTCALADTNISDDDGTCAGHLYIWGRGMCVCERYDILEPRKFAHIESRFTHVACCAAHTLATTVIGEIYAWGDNSSGQLGQLAATAEAGDGDVMPRQTRLPPRPRLLATGPEHSISVFADKDTYCWGNQNSGRLGLAEKVAPRIVDRPGKVAAKWASVEAMGHSMDKAEQEVEKYDEQQSEDSSDVDMVATNQEESPLLRWWIDHLASLRSMDHLFVKDVGRIVVDDVGKVTGEAFLADVRGEKRAMFDLKFHLDVTLFHQQTKMTPRKTRRTTVTAASQDVSETPHKGKVVFSEFSSVAHKKKKIPVELAKFPQEAYDVVQEHFVPLLKKQLDTWVKEYQWKCGGSDARAHEQPDSNKRMLRAIVTHQQKVTLFSTMQALLKNEPEDSKMAALQALEAKLKKDLQTYFMKIQELPAKEEKVLKLETDFQQSLVANLRFIKKLPSPDYSKEMGVFSTKYEYYQELLWILQQQGFYLGTLSMMLNGEQDAHTFDTVVACLYREKDNSRTINLFLALMKVIIFKEIEQAKSLKELFLRDSCAFRLLRAFALHRVHYEEVVHPIMDGMNPETLLGKVCEMVEHNQVISFSPKEYQEFPQHRDRLREYDPTEVKNEFNASLPAVRKFFRSDLIGVLRQYKLPHTLLKLFTYAVQEIKKRQFPDATSSTDISAELMLHWPVLYLYVRAILIPMMRNVSKYAGREVFLSMAWREKALEEDVNFNLDKICELLEAITSGIASDDAVQTGQDLLASIAKTTRPEMLKLMMDSVEDCFDDTDTLVTIDIYLSHFDRSPHTVSVRTSALMKLSNLLRRNLSKLRLNQNDPIDRLCEKIGEWTPEQIAAEEKEKDVLHNFTINTRWLFKEKHMVICPTSHCPVPARFSTSSSEDDGTEVELLMRSTIEKSKYYEQIAVVESLFCELDPLNCTTFEELVYEMRRKQKDCTAKSNFEMAERLQYGIKGIDGLKDVGCSPQEFLRWMADAASERDIRRRYLEDVKREITSIRSAEKKHCRELEEAETQLLAALNMSRNLSVPQPIKTQAKEQGLRIKLDTVRKQMKDVDEVGRKEIKNCSYSPMVTKSLPQLRRERIVTTVDPWLESIERAGGQVHLTFVLTERGANVTVTVSRVQYWRTVKSNVRYLQISTDRLQDIQRADENALMDIPEDKPLLKVSSLNLGHMLHKLQRG